MGTIINSGIDSVHVMQSGTKAGNNTAGAIVKMGNSALDRLSSNMDILYAQAGLISSGVVDKASAALNEAGTILGKVDTNFTDLTDTLDSYEKTLCRRHCIIK